MCIVVTKLVSASFPCKHGEHITRGQRSRTLVASVGESHGVELGDEIKSRRMHHVALIRGA